MLFEKTALLSAEPSLQKPSDSFGQTGILGTLYNLLNCVMGVGILTLSYGLSTAGLAVGILILILVSVLSNITLRLLVKCSDQTGSFSYKEVGEIVFGKKCGILFEFLIMGYGIGTCISMTVIVSNMVPKMIEAAFNVAVERYVVIAIASVVCFLPLSLFRDLSALRFSSFFSVLGVIVSVVVVFSQFLKDGVTTAHHVDYVLTTPIDLMASIPLYSVAFLCHLNCLALYKELKNRTSQKMNFVINLTSGTSLCLYILMSASGYLLYGSDVDGDLTNNFPSKNIPIFIVRFCMTFTILFSYPVLFLASKRAAFNMFFSSEMAKREIVNFPLTIFGIALLSLSAFLLPQVQVPAGCVGAVFGASLVYIVPSLLYVKLFQGDALDSFTSGITPFRITAFKGLAGLGVLLGIGGLVVTLKNAIDK
eukprot:GCRY01000976.1.p1 GENE.GCRY01000976.1~~GCRY01000976.1.p1  ORF type:complete len:422 (+),score=83.80 GCRY01000976.1:141-1406(+)